MIHHGEFEPRFDDDMAPVKPKKKRRKPATVVPALAWLTQCSGAINVQMLDKKPSANRKNGHCPVCGTAVDKTTASGTRSSLLGPPMMELARCQNCNSAFWWE